MTIGALHIDRWLAAPAEHERLEFKLAANTFGIDKVLDYCVAIANEGGGFLVLGVTDAAPRQVKGTLAFPNVQDTRERIFSAFRRRVEVHEVMHPHGRVLVFEIPSRPRGEALSRDGRFLMRVGERLEPMTFDQMQRIAAEALPDPSARVLPGISLESLDASLIQVFRERWARKAGSNAIAALDDQQLLHDAGLMLDGSVTVGALVLFGTTAALGLHLPQAEVVFEYRASESSTDYQARHAFRQGFFAFVDQLWELIDRRNERQSYQEGLFRYEIPAFDERAVREAVLNAVCHRDYTLGGSVFVRQYARHLTIVSPGGFPAGVTVENVLDRQNPRNRSIAEALERCGLVERSGQGMNRMYEVSIRQGKLLPDLSGTDVFQVSLTLDGNLRHPAFVRYLERLGADRLQSFTTQDLLVLDHAQRGEPVPESLRGRVDRLLDIGAVERAGRKLILSRELYAGMGQRGVYTRRRGLDHATQKELLLKHIRDNAADGCPLSELLQVLPSASDRHVKRLLQELKAEGKIVPSGQRRWARWQPATPSGSPLDNLGQSATPEDSQSDQ